MCGLLFPLLLRGGQRKIERETEEEKKGNQRSGRVEKAKGGKCA